MPPVRLARCEPTDTREAADEPSMTSSRSDAYGRVMRMLGDLGASKFHDHEQAVIREAADTMFICERLESDEPEPHASGYEPHCNGRRVYLPRGKVLGGSSSINAMIYIRGNRADYDEWRDLVGPGWGYDDLLPYFKRAEDNERGADEWHGSGGPLPVSEGRSRNEMSQAFIDAAVARGYEANDDFNGARQEGEGWYQVTHRNGAPASAAVAYLHPVMDRPNLTVETHVEVVKLLFEGTRAVGVQGVRLSQPLEWRAEREVIVSGGTYNSPHLLQLS